MIITKKKGGGVGWGGVGKKKKISFTNINIFQVWIFNGKSKEV